MFDTATSFDLYQAGEAEPEPVSDPLVGDLGWLPPGVMLAAALGGADRDRLSGFDRVSLLQARSRLIAHLQAEQLADIQSVNDAITELTNDSEPDLEHVFDATASEISAALSLTRRASEVQVDLAYRLCACLPHVWTALSEGVIDLPRARVLADQTTHLPRNLARQVCDTALERAGSQTTGQIRAWIQRLIISIDPASARDRYEEKLGERRVMCEPTDAGTADIHASDLPADRANAAMGRINRLAHTAKRNGDRRCIDLIRADIFLDLLTGSHEETNGADGAVVDIKADLPTLLGLAETPGEIPGWGPVIADVTRQLDANTPDAEWRFGITHL
ncbi:MAG: DUF222 domain-containing protein, partial [Acidimicrobiia bacterium]